MDRARTDRESRRAMVSPRTSAWMLVAILVMLSATLTLAEDASSGDATPAALSPSIAVSPGWEVSLGTEIVLDASTSDHGIPEELVDEVRYIWDLGDGTIQVGERVTHRYGALGTFRIVLTMEVFEQSGIFHRRTATADTTVALAEFPRFVTVIDLETGYAQPGEFAVLFQIEDQYLLIGQQGSPTRLPTEQPRVPFRLPPELEGLVFSGGLITVGDLRLWNGTVAMELAQDGWLASAGFGMSSSDTSVSLTHLYPVIANEGYELVGVIERANLVSLGLCYEAVSNLYLLASLGSLYVEGIYEGSSRLTLDDELLPAPFAGRMVTLGFGLGLRIGPVMLSLQALLTL